MRVQLYMVFWLLLLLLLLLPAAVAAAAIAAVAAAASVAVAAVAARILYQCIGGRLAGHEENQKLRDLQPSPTHDTPAPETPVHVIVEFHSGAERPIVYV